MSFQLPADKPEFAALEEFNTKQMHIFWLPEEIKVEKDIQDVLVNFSPSERHGVITTLKLFSIYEDHAGNEWWGGRFKKIFEDNIQALRMGSTFAFFENSVHGPFYNKINQLLHIDTEQFYASYKDSDALKSRVEHIGRIIDDEDDLVALGMFSMVEGVILYSNFAYLKHFQSQGKNKLMNVVRGINFSLRDENLHSIASAWCFQYLMKKRNISAEQAALIESKIRDGARTLFEHERQIIEMIFAEGKVDGITETQLVNFVQSRINECLKQLGYSKEYTVNHNPVAEWFYKSLSDFSFNDFFSAVGSEYQRNWDETGFVWKVAA